MPNLFARCLMPGIRSYVVTSSANMGLQLQTSSSQGKPGNRLSKQHGAKTKAAGPGTCHCLPNPPSRILSEFACRKSLAAWMDNIPQRWTPTSSTSLKPQAVLTDGSGVRTYCWEFNPSCGRDVSMSTSAS